MIETVAPHTEQNDPEIIKSQELKNSILKICEPLCISLYKEKPKNITSFMINWLKDKYNISSSLLNNEEKKEIEMLKNKVEIFHEMDEHFYFVETQLKAKKEAKIVEKKNKVPPKPKPRLPPDEIIPSDDEDNNPDEIDIRLDDRQYIESNSRGEYRLGTFEILEKNIEEVKIKYHNKSPEDFEFMKINLMKSPLFSDLPLYILEKCINSMEEKYYSAMTEIVKQGDFSEMFYFILEGELECKMGFTKVTRDGNKKKIEKFDPRLVKVFYPGDYFGELNLLYHVPIRGTIKTITEAKIYILDRKIYKKLLNNSFKERNEKRIVLFKKIPIFGVLKDEELEKMNQIVKEAIYYKGDTIIKENEFSNMLMIIEEGNCIGKQIVEKGKIPQKKKEYKEYQIFFEESLLKPEKSQESIIAESDVVKFICIDRYTFKNIFGSLEQILMRDMDLYKKYFPPLPEIVEEFKIVPPVGFEGENINPDNIQPQNLNDMGNGKPQNISINNVEQINSVNNKFNNNNIEELIKKINELNKENEEMKDKIKKQDDEIIDLKSQIINGNNIIEAKDLKINVNINNNNDNINNLNSIQNNKIIINSENNNIDISSQNNNIDIISQNNKDINNQNNNIDSQNNNNIIDINNTKQNNNTFNSNQDNNFNNKITVSNQDNNNKNLSQNKDNDNINIVNLNQNNENINNNINDMISNNINSSIIKRENEGQIPDFLKEKLEVNIVKDNISYGEGENNNKITDKKNDSVKESIIKSENPYESNNKNTDLNEIKGEIKGHGYFEEDDEIH